MFLSGFQMSSRFQIPFEIQTICNPTYIEHVWTYSKKLLYKLRYYSIYYKSNIIYQLIQVNSLLVIYNHGSMTYINLQPSSVLDQLWPLAKKLTASLPSYLSYTHRDVTLVRYSLTSCYQKSNIKKCTFVVFNMNAAQNRQYLCEGRMQTITQLERE